MKITVITAGHLSTCPRMLKAADALAEEGHDVHVVSTRSTPWAAAADEAVRKRWDWCVVDYTREGAPLTYAWSGVKQKLATRIARYRETIPFAEAARGVSRVHDALVRAALATGADFYYGGTVGAVGATFQAANRARREYALDLEDFYPGNDPRAPERTRLIERVETEALSGARFLTAASAGIAEAYRSKYGVDPVVVHNTFPLPRKAPALAARGNGLKLYWFSQTIGRGRGLEDVVEGLRRADVAGELHVRGNPDADFLGRLEKFVADNAPQLRLVAHPPAPPDEMIELLAGYDVGLAIEPRSSVNNELALSNKALAYVLGGLALVMTETAGHRPLIDDLGEYSVHYAPGDTDRLTSGLAKLANDRDFLERCREASWEAAQRRWHWEHPDERGRLVNLFAFEP